RPSGRPDSVSPASYHHELFPLAFTLAERIAFLAAAFSWATTFFAARISFAVTGILPLPFRPTPPLPRTVPLPPCMTLSSLPKRHDHAKSSSFLVIGRSFPCPGRSPGGRCKRRPAAASGVLHRDRSGQDRRGWRVWLRPLAAPAPDHAARYGERRSSYR